MTPDTFAHAMKHVAASARQGLQPELNLAGIGESTLHPDLIHWIHWARRTAPDTRIVLTTNGLEFREEHAQACAASRVRVFVSLHRPERAQKAVQLAREYGVLEGLSTDAANYATDWAGQVDWPQIAPPSPCPWWRQGMVMVTAEGDITTCCLDASGVGVIGRVEEAMDTWRMKPYALCQKCYQTLDIPRWDQSRGAWRN
jgi:MoaA/NifB/PqqE/SkfB family radical SAM enzyme